MNKQFELIDAWDEDRPHPRTFEVPPLGRIRELEVGDYVNVGVEGPIYASNPRVPGGIRLTFRIPATGDERFWVRITHIAFTEDHHLSIRGVVTQDDMLLGAHHGIKNGDEIRVLDKHILGMAWPKMEVAP